MSTAVHDDRIQIDAAKSGPARRRTCTPSCRRNAYIAEAGEFRCRHAWAFTAQVIPRWARQRHGPDARAPAARSSVARPVHRFFLNGRRQYIRSVCPPSLAPAPMDSNQSYVLVNAHHCAPLRTIDRNRLATCVARTATSVPNLPLPGEPASARHDGLHCAGGT
jgi:hypothetical protein